MAGGEPISATQANVPQLPNHTIKLKNPGQRARNEKSDKGKFCGGCSQRWFYTDDGSSRVWLGAKGLGIERGECTAASSAGLSTCLPRRTRG